MKEEQSFIAFPKSKITPTKHKGNRLQNGKATICSLRLRLMLTNKDFIVFRVHLLNNKLILFFWGHSL